MSLPVWQNFSYEVSPSPQTENFTSAKDTSDAMKSLKKLTAVSGGSPSPHVETITKRFEVFARSAGETSDIFFILA